MTSLIRISKSLSKSGICSRRDAEKLILSGRVRVNDKVVTILSTKVLPTDLIKVDDKLVKNFTETRLWLYHKKSGFIVSNKDPFKRPTIFQDLKEKIDSNFLSVGRLDMNSEGLLILTNNGDLARHLELPSSNYLRKYWVQVNGLVEQFELDLIKNGIIINNMIYTVTKCFVKEKKKNKTSLEIHLKEGKNREIRKIMDFLGFSVIRLIRFSYGPFELNSIKPGCFVEINKKKIKKLFNLN